MVECVAVTRMPTKYGEFMAHCYVNKLNGEHHVALVKGDIGDGSNLFVQGTFRVPDRRRIWLNEM